MEQKCYEYYCNFLKKEIGLGMRCFNCEHFERSETADKKCKHEKVIRHIQEKYRSYEEDRHQKT